MRPLGVVGIILIILGIIGFAYGGMSWSSHKKDAQLGPVEIGHQESHGFTVPPVLSGILVVGGIVLVIAGARRA